MHAEFMNMSPAEARERIPDWHRSLGIASADGRPSVVLKYNNTGSKEVCPLCLREDRAGTGLWSFIEGTWITVCAGCVERQYPHLFPLLGYDPDQHLVIEQDWTP